MTFEELFDRYSKTQGFNSLSVASKRGYIYAAKKLSAHFGDADVTKLRRSDFIKYRDENIMTPGSVNLILRIASVMFGYALDIDLIGANPVANMKKLKLQPHEKWTPEEVALIISSADERVAIAIALAWYTGQRQGDVLSMKMRDYADGYITLVQSKTKTELKIKVHPDLERFINTVVAPNREPDDYIVSGPNRMGGSYFRQIFSDEVKRLGLHKVFHGIRKGVASSLAENGRPLSEIAAMLGHKSMRMAAYYAEQASGTKLAESAVSNLTTVIVHENKEGYPESTFSS